MNIEDIAYITGQTDRMHLISALNNALVNAFPQHRVRLYLPFQNGQPWQFQPSSQAVDNQQIQRDLAVIENWHDGAPEHPEHNCTCIPIISGSQRFGVVFISGHITERQHAKLLGLMAILANHLVVMHSAATDPLTELNNRQTLLSQLNNALLSQHQRESDTAQQWYVALLDIDHFKAVNDNFGHLAGDEVLLRLAQLMVSSFRGQDLLFRYGGEEFAVMFQANDHTLALTIAERFRQKVANFNFPQVQRLTISLGVAAAQADSTPLQLLKQADDALYHSKAHGRNQVTGYWQLTPTSSETHSGDIELF